MKKFKDLFTSGAYNSSIQFPTVTATLNDHTLELKFDSKDVVLEAAYLGPTSPWLSSLCHLIIGKRLNDLLALNWKSWDEAFQDDQMFWDLKQEQEELFFNRPFELLKVTLDLYRGREYLYQESSPLICRCFGIRESDVISHLESNKNPTLETLAGETKAGMGCRSCVPQLNRWLVLHEKKRDHHYKERPVVDWMVEIDYMLSCFPEALDWKMEVKSMKGNQVFISFDKSVTQKEEEKVAKELQDFLGASVDTGLSFFLRAARHFSKAKG